MAFINTQNIMLRNTILSHHRLLSIFSYISNHHLKGSEPCSHFDTTEQQPDSQTRCKASYSGFSYAAFLIYPGIIFSKEKQEFSKEKQEWDSP